MSGAAERQQPADLSALAKREGQHKYDHGHALILAGGPGRGGAARLAARGALRVGAGLVTLACPSAALSENAAQLTAIMLAEAEGVGGLRVLLRDRRLNAVCLGPGLGAGAATRDQVKAVLAARRATVVDADGLSCFASEPSDLVELLHDRAVLTPHEGEFARVFPDLAEGLTSAASDTRREAVVAAAGRSAATVLLKGPVTIVADPSGRVGQLDMTGTHAVPWLATAGSGDVLAGLITGLLARGLAPFEAALTAAELHAACARHIGPGLISEDLPDAIPAVFRDLGL